VSTIFKLLIAERDTWVLSGGVGVTWPTAEDFHFNSLFSGTFPFENLLPPPYPPVGAFEIDTLVDMQAANETIYLAPFMAWLWAPTPRWFHQGFCQVEVAANPSAIKISADGDVALLIPNQPPIFGSQVIPARETRVDLQAQTLLRLNLGTGYVLMDDPSADWIQTLTGLVEAHYTTTLQDAKFSTVRSLFLTSGGAFELDQVRIGNAANRVDILNVALGVQANMGKFIVTNGFIAPVRDDMDRGFDFEYNLQVQRPF
jgi:hypothetical protein